MSPNPLVSIIAPTCNHEAFIGRCIESVLAQTYPNWEMIIINDGSTDGTQRVIETYSDPRIIATHQDNRGVAPTTMRFPNPKANLYGGGRL